MAQENNGQPVPQVGKKPIAVIHIEFDPNNGKIGLNAPWQNKVLAYGMLEMAKEIISKQQVDQEESPIARPTPAETAQVSH